MDRTDRVTEIGGYYHIYNRGVDKRDIYLSEADYQYFLLGLDYYRDSQAKQPLSQTDTRRIDPLRLIKQPVVEVLCYYLLPNHYHLLVREDSTHGVGTYLSKIQNSYTQYFNTHQHRSGHLFQGPFQIVQVETDEQLLILSRYIHLQGFTAQLTNSIESPWSSVGGYLASEKTFCNTKLISSLAKSQSYRDFLENYKEYARTLATIKHLLHE